MPKGKLSIIVHYSKAKVISRVQAGANQPNFCTEDKLCLCIISMRSFNITKMKNDVRDKRFLLKLTFER